MPRSKIIILLLLLIVSGCLFSCKTHKDVATGFDRQNVVQHENEKKSCLYDEVKSWIGTPYKYGGNNKRGVDCSGFVVQVYKKVYGVSLQRSSDLIYEKNCEKIKKNDLQEGDLVFFSTGRSKKINHVGIYLNSDKFIHASSSRGVIVSDLDESYYVRTYVSSGRVKDLK